MIRFPLREKPLKLKGAIIGTGSGPAERIKQLQILVTNLVRRERIEGREDRMQETRAYAEQLLNLAISNGDKHGPTMAMADKWLLEKDLVHKLFKVLAPRYSTYSTTYTQIYTLPAKYPGTGRYQAVLELKGNPYPPVVPHQRDTKHLLSNVLVRAASRDYFTAHSSSESYRNAKSFGNSGGDRLKPSVGNDDVDNAVGTVSTPDGNIIEETEQKYTNHESKPS